MSTVIAPNFVQKFKPFFSMLIQINISSPYNQTLISGSRNIVFEHYYQFQDIKGEILFYLFLVEKYLYKNRRISKKII